MRYDFVIACIYFFVHEPWDRFQGSRDKACPARHVLLTFLLILF